MQKKNVATQIPLACWNNNSKERISATSGGIFTTLAKKIVEDGGIVYGAAHNQEMKVVHTRIDTKDDIFCLRG